MRVTIREAARRAGVGIGAVSQVLNHKRNVSENARRQLLESVEALGYWPNVATKSLRSHRARDEWAYVRVVTEPPFIETLRRIEQKLAVAGPSLIIFRQENRANRDFIPRPALD